MAVESYLGCGSLKVGGVVTGILSLVCNFNSFIYSNGKDRL